MALHENEYDRISLLSDDGNEFHIIASDTDPRTGGGKTAPQGSLCLTKEITYRKDTVDDVGWTPL